MLGSWQAKFTLFIGLMYIIGQLTGFYPIVSAFQAAGSVLSHLASLALRCRPPRPPRAPPARLKAISSETRTVAIAPGPPAGVWRPV